MSKRGWFHLALARKISLLFGSAVMLVIVVTLWSPWVQMEALNLQTMLARAHRLASAARQAADLHQPDWREAQAQLDFRWPFLAKELDLGSEAPRLVPVRRDLPKRGFRHEAIVHLTDRPGQDYYWKLQDDQRIFRFALAIRSTDADPHPDALRGIIDVRLAMPQDRGIWNTLVTILAGASGAVLAILVFYVVTQRLVLSPVHDLRRAAEQVAAGDMQVQTTITTGDEFQRLSETFNEMLAHLREAQEQQKKINRSLDIKLGELAETNVALYESNRVKTEFLANVSHELRTPLVSIIGFAELLRDAWESTNPDKTRLARYSENIRISGRSLLEIINDLLDLAKIEAGKMTLHLSTFSIQNLCRDLVDFVRPLADERKQELALVTNGDLPQIHSDAGKLKQILYNLLSNAVKFTPSEGRITMGVSHAEEALRIFVQDTGPGIAPSEHESVFEKFRQLDASETREYEGTGLGLAITRELLVMLGGSIELESEVGQGAKFTVTLPLAVGESASTAARPRPPAA